MSKGIPRISVVIPTHNAGPRFAQTLAAISGQKAGEPFELVVIDSGSTDRTLDLCRAHGAQVLRIPHSRFNHGKTRNEAITHCRGEYVALTVQDAVPANEYWLLHLVRTLDRTPAAAGAYSQHLPHKGASFIARQVASYWHQHQRGRVEQRIDDSMAFENLSLEEKQACCTFNNVSSIIRRSAWEMLPFREISFAEDLAWGYDLLRAGYSIIYEPASAVRHSHERSLHYELGRAYVESRVVGELFEAQARTLRGRDLWGLWRFWRQTQVHAQGLRYDDDVHVELESLAQDVKTRDWYQQNFGRSALCRIIGGLSPYPLAEQSDLELLLDQCQARVESEPNADQTGPISQSIIRSVWHNDRRALSAANLAFTFDCFWDEIGRDYVRRAVLEDIQTNQHAGYPFLQTRTRDFVNSLARAAVQEEELNGPLFQMIWAYAASVIIGRRLGEANRYGAGGRWGRIVHTWLARGI